MPQPSQVTTYPSRVWDPGQKTFVENVNRELSSDNLTTVAVKDTNEVVGFPDGMAVDEMEHAIKGDINGVIKPWKMSFYEKNIQQPLANMGVSAFQPRFITDIKPSAERAFVTSFARGATADIIKPDFSDKEAAAYPKEAMAGQLAGAIVGLKGMGVLLQGIKLPTFGAYALKVLGKIPEPAQKIAMAAAGNAAVAGAYRGVSETSNEIRYSDHPELTKIGQAVLHDALWWGGIGGAVSPLSKLSGVFASGGLGYVMAKADGATETDALLNGGILAGFHAVSSHGADPKVRQFTVDNIEKNIGDYVQAKNPLVDVNVAQQTAREKIYLQAEKVLADMGGKDNIVRDKNGKPIELNVDAQGKDAVTEVLKAQETTVKMVESIANEVINPEGKNAAGETPVEIKKENEIKLKQLQISREDAVAKGNTEAVARIDKLIEKNTPVEIPEFKNTEEALAFGEKYKDNPQVLADLKTNREEIQARYKKLSEDPNATPEMEKEAFRLAQVAQFPREALEAAAGKISKAKAKSAIDKIKGLSPEMEKAINSPEVVKAREASKAIPETYTINTPERKALREKIATKGYGKGAKNKNRRVDIVLGGPASGKSQVVKPLVKEHGSMIIDSDIYKEKLPEYAGGLGAAAVHKESSNIVEGAILDKALKAGDNIVYPRLGKNPKEIKRLVDLFNANGYDVHLHNVELPVEKAMQRAITRFKEQGRFVDPLFVKDVGLTPRETYGILKTDKGVKSYGTYSADVPKGEAPKVLERSGAVGNGKRGVQRADSNQNTGKKRGSVSKPKASEEVKPPKKLLSGESGQATLPGVENLAETAKEVTNLVSPKTFVPKEALDEIMKMKGGLDRHSFELGSRLEEVVKAMDKWTKEEQIAFVDNIKLGKQQADPAVQKLADMMRTIEDARWAEAKEFKESLAYKENHFRVLWKTIPGSKEASGKKGFKGLFRRPLQGTKGFAKKSTLESMSEGIAMGGEPYTYNPMKMWIDGQIDMEKFITAQRMFRSMKEMGYAKFIRTGGDVPEGFVKIDDSIARVYFPAEIKYSKDGESYTVVHQVGEYYIEENVGRILNNYIGKDWIRTSNLGQGLLALKNITTSIELSLSPFHAAYVSLSTASASVGLGTQKIINQAIMQRNPKAFLDGLKDIALSGISPVDYARTGGRAIRFISKEDFINTPEGKDFIKEYPDAKRLMEDLFTGGGKLAMHEDYKINAVRSFQDGIKNKEPWAVALSAIPAANEVMMRPLFETYIPRLKIGTFLKEYSMELNQRKSELVAGTLTRPELARRVWDSVENRLGEMNFDNLFWQRTFKSSLQLAFRSVTWKLGALKNIGVSLPEQIMEFKKAYDQGRAPLLTGNMGWLFGVAALATAFSYVTMGMSGQGKPKDLKDIIAPRYDKEGNRISLNTHIKDWVHLWHNPLGFVANSLTGELGRAADLWNNKDFYGVEIYHDDDPALKKAVDMALHLVPIPFSISNQVQLKGEQAPNVLKASTVLGLTQPSPGYISNTPAEEKAHEINREKLPVGSRTKEAFEKSTFKKDLRLSYEKTGDSTEIDKAVDEGKISPRESRQIIKDAESSTMQRLTKNMSYNEILKVIEKAEPKELADLIPLFNKKIRAKINDANTTDEANQLEDLRDKVNQKYSQFNQ